jgi:hypothetical protein
MCFIKKKRRIFYNMNTNILRLIAESQKESINEKKLAKARQLCKEVEELCKKYDMSFFFVTEGASITRNKGNDAVRNAREAQVRWEKENRFDPDEDWDKK